MTLEVRPLGVACNLSCTYCYQDPQRDSGNFRQAYDLERMKAALTKAGGPFTLFGGEPLLVPLADLEELWRFGLEQSGKNSIQTNGALISEEHLQLFEKYKVEVGISIDGPAECNDLRWNGSLEKTRAATARTEAAIERLCQLGRAPGLIITLHRGNAVGERLQQLKEWLLRLDAQGVTSARLHLLEVDAPVVRERYALSPRENVEVLRELAALQAKLSRLRLDLMSEMGRLLKGDDRSASCVWHACDPYTTEAVRGVEGNGQSSNCGRTNKDGIDFTKASESGYERYLALYSTPREYGGCQGCRFFLMCKGQCPGTAIGGDWRNRTEHCEVWMSLFTEVERELVRRGEVPLTLHPLRRWLEGQLVRAWAQGRNPSLRSLPREEPVGTLKPLRFCRLSWVSDAARELWQPRIERLAALQGELALLRVANGKARCAVAPVQPAQIGALWQRANRHGLGIETLSAPPPGDRSTPGTAGQRGAQWVLIGSTADQAEYRRLLEDGSAGAKQALASLLGVPECCGASAAQLSADAEPLWEMAAGAAPGAPVTVAAEPHLNVLIQRLGVRAVLHQPCSFGCSASAAIASESLALLRGAGFGIEADWLAEVLSFATSWSALHGIAEIKTPVFRMITETAPTMERRALHRPGVTEISAAGKGLGFPYQAPRRVAQLRLLP